MNDGEVRCGEEYAHIKEGDMRVKGIVLAFVLVIAGAALCWSDSAMMSVQVKEGQLRSAPSFLGTVVGPVTYGERVTLVQQQGDWMDVKSSKDLRGWIHQSALTKKQVVMGSGGQAQAGASGQEIALAGKGFNSEVESRYRNTHRVDFTWVDRMESIRVSGDEMVRFLNDGQVKSSEGGSK